MKAFLDTSVLVPVFYGDHVHHDASLDVFTRFSKTEVCCEAHSLVEVYASLTRMPGKHRISPDHAMLFIGNIRERLTVVGLTPDEYADMLQNAAEKALPTEPFTTRCWPLVPSNPGPRSCLRGISGITASSALR